MENRSRIRSDPILGPYARIVRRLHRYYGAVRLPTSVRRRRVSIGLLDAVCGLLLRRRVRDLPVPKRGAFVHARVSGRPEPLRVSRMATHSVWPSLRFHEVEVGAPESNISRLNGWPARAPINASLTLLRAPTHDSGSMRVATPFIV